MISDFKYYYLPYNLSKISKGLYIVKSRSYIPINESNFVKLTRMDVKRLNFKGIYEDSFYLYDDACAPGTSIKGTDDYLSKIEYLLKKNCVSIDKSTKL